MKTWDEADNKVFINVCTTDRVPLPTVWTQDGPVPKIVRELGTPVTKDEEAGICDNPALRVPMVFSSPRPDVDHKGERCAGTFRT